MFYYFHVSWPNGHELGGSQKMTDKFKITEEVSVLKGALKLLKHYDEVYQQYKELKDTEVVPTEVIEAPTPKPIPKKPVASDKVFQSHKTLCDVLALVILAGITLLFCLYLIPQGIYKPVFKYEIAGYYVTEIHVGFIIALIICMVFNSIVINGLAKKVNKQSEEIEKWVDEKIAVKDENRANQEAYFARQEEQEKQLDEIRKKNELQLQAYMNTMKHIQQDYMRTYASKIPNNIASVEGLETKIAELEEMMKEPLMQAETQPVFSNPFPELADEDLEADD